jgi:hypothetical protein
VLVSHHVGRIGSVLHSLIEVDEGRATKRFVGGSEATAGFGANGRDAPVDSTA